MKSTLRIAWYLGFGWGAIAAFIACGVAINLVGDGWLRWALYVPFVLLGVHLSIRLRTFNTQRWRRVHGRAMITYGKLALAEYDAAQRENRAFDVGVPCRQLAVSLFGERGAAELAPVLGVGRKAYYHELLEAHPQVFLDGVDPSRQTTVVDSVRDDIEASRLGPDIVIAKAIERQHNRFEAARYLHALLLGRVR